MQDFKHLQLLLDKIANCSAQKLPDFIYGYSRCSPDAQKILIAMLSLLRPPLADLRMAVREVRKSGRFTMIVAYLPWPHGKEAPGLRPIIVCGEAGHEQVVAYVLPFNEILIDLGKDKTQEVIRPLSPCLRRNFWHAE